MIFRIFSLIYLTAATELIGATIIDVDPKATFYRTYSDPASDAVAINLGAYGFSAGDTINLDEIGSLNWGGGCAIHLTGVFSSSSVLLPSGNQYRVAGALASTAPQIITLPTFYGGLATDIQEDFYITGGLSVQIPAGASYLFVSALDNYFADNSPGPNGFQVSIAAVPDAAETGLLLSFSVLGLCIVRRQTTIQRLGFRPICATCAILVIMLSGSRAATIEIGSTNVQSGSTFLVPVTVDCDQALYIQASVGR